MQLVVDPHAQRVVGVQDEAGKSHGEATPLNPIGNVHRTRHKARAVGVELAPRSGPNLVEIAHQQYHGLTQPNKGD